jgi:predicted ATPase
VIMGAEVWAQIIAPAVLSLLGAATLAVWRRQYRDERREFRRIYKKARSDIKPEEDSLRRSLDTVLRGHDFWARIDPPEAQSRAEEREILRGLLVSHGAREGLELDRTVASFYQSVLRGLAGAKSQRWKDHAKRWVDQDRHETRDSQSGGSSGKSGARHSLPPSNVGVPRIRLVGRSKELKEAQELLSRQDLRLLTLVGTGGVGKSALAYQLAVESRGAFSGNAYWVDLSTIPSREYPRVASYIAQVLGAEPAQQDLVQASALGSIEGFAQGRAPIWLDAVATLLGDQQVLLVLDNFEHVANAAKDVGDLLARCPRLSLITTSRRPLGLYGIEHELAVSQLPVPSVTGEESLLELSSNPSVEMFVERAQEKVSDFRLTLNNALYVAKICGRLEGLPYMIEVIAPMLKYYQSPARLWQELSERPIYNVRLPGKRAESRHDSAATVTAWSYDLLSPAEQYIFRCSAVFAGTFSVEAVSAITARDSPTDAEDSLFSLIDNNLVHPTRVGQDHGELRFRLLETTREYAAEVLRDSGEAEKIAMYHAGYYLKIAYEGAIEIKQEVDQHILDQLAPDQENFRAAFRYFLGRDIEKGLNIAWSLSVLLDARGRRIEAVDVLDLALAPALPVGESVNPEAQLRALDQAALLAVKQADCPQATMFSERMLQLSRRTESRIDIAEALHRLARSTYFLCQYDTVRSLLAESRLHFTELKMDRRLASVLFDLGAVELDESNFTLAREYFTQSLDLLAASDGKRDDQGRTHVYIAFVSQRLGDAAEVDHHLAEAERLLEGQNYYRWYLHFRARIDVENGDFSSAHTHFLQSAKLFLERRDRLGIVRSLLGLAFLAAKETVWRDAVRRLAAEERLRVDMGLPFPPDWRSEKDFIDTGALRTLSLEEISTMRREGAMSTWDAVMDSQAAAL